METRNKKMKNFVISLIKKRRFLFTYERSDMTTGTITYKNAPEEELNVLGIETQVDHQVKKLSGLIMFQLTIRSKTARE